MGTRTTNTARLLDRINKDVGRYLKYKEKAERYDKRKKNIKEAIFDALHKIPKDDYRLYSEKIERMIKRLNQIK